MTFVHGDYRGENMLRPRSRRHAGAGADFAVVDWQGCGLGAGLYDVAYFLGTNVVPGDRRRIERAALGEYHDIVCRLGARDLRRLLAQLSPEHAECSMPCILAWAGSTSATSGSTIW